MKRKSIPLRNQRIMMHPAELAESNRGSFYPHRRGHVHWSPGLVASPRSQTVIEGASGETSVSLLL